MTHTMNRERIIQALTEIEPRKAIDALVWAFDDMMRQRDELLEALKGEATEVDGRLCWCTQPNMIKYRGHDSGCDSNRELVAKATGEGAR